MTSDINVANVLTIALTNLNIILVVGRKERKTVNYLTFSKKSDENIDDFITKLEKIFAVNRVFDNRKHLITVSYLKKTAVNFYNGLAEIMEWNVVRQVTNTQLKSILETRFQSKAQATHYYNQYLVLK